MELDAVAFAFRAELIGQSGLPGVSAPSSHARPFGVEAVNGIAG